MESVQKLAILNLTGPLTAELQNYFSERNITVIDPLRSESLHSWSHILTKDIHDFDLIKSTYMTVENDIKLISLSSVLDVQSFVLANGKLVFDELWLRNEIGSFILDKFFQEYGGINLGDNYPTFHELGSFNVVNPFNTGEYLDKLTHCAFSEGVDALSVKTSFDHLIMYLTGLKNKGKVGLPLEVTYGKFNDVFGLQFNFFTEDLMLEDVTSSLSPSIKKKAEEYLFNVSIQATDFFDFTFLGEVKKAVVTLLWTQDERIKYENKGLMFTNLNSSSAITGFRTDGISSSLINEVEPMDFSDKITLPASKDVGEETRISGEHFSEALAEKISTSMELEKIKQIVSGDLNPDNFEQLIAGLENVEVPPQVVKGSGDEDEVKIVISSQDSMDEIIQIVKGKVEEEKDIFKVSGGKFDIDNFAFRVTSGLNDKIKGDEVLKVKVLNQDLPQIIKSGLFDFAAKINKELDDLTDSDLEAFGNYEIPKLVKKHTEVNESQTLSSLSQEGQIQARGFLESFKNNFQNVLKEEFLEDSVDDIVVNIKTPNDELKIKKILKATLKKSLDEKFHLSSKNSISNVEQEVLVKALTTSLSENEDHIRSILDVEKNESLEKEVTPLFKEMRSNEPEQVLVKDDKLLEENSNLKNKLKVLMSELKTLKDTQNKVLEIDKKVKDIHKDEPLVVSDPDKELREKFTKELIEKKFINEQDALKLASLLERETQLITNMKEQEIALKKQQIESGQKETFYTQEIEKANRLVKSKDTAISKAKDSLSKITERKDYEIRDLHLRLEQLNMAFNNGQQQNQINVIRDLERQNANMSKMVEVYRNKVTTLASSIGRNSTKHDDSKLKEEVRKLQMVNNQLKNLAEVGKKDVQRFKEKSEQEEALIAMLKNDKQRLEAQLKSVNSEASMPSQGTVLPSSNDEAQKLYAQTQLLDSQLKEAIQRCKDYEAKIGDMQRAQRLGTSSEEFGKVKVTQLENSVKKLTQDLVDSRNQLSEMKKETNKLRQEKTALQNQFDKFKKDAEKAKAAAPKKTNGRAA